MATNGDLPSEDESLPEDQASDGVDGHEVDDAEEEEDFAQKPKSALKKISRLDPPPEVKRPKLPEQPDPEDLDVSTLTPLSPEIIARQATINIGTIGHVAHGKSTVVKAISGVQTVRFKNELERNITIKLGYANAKVYKCDNEECPRPGCYRSYKSEKEIDPPCEREGCQGRYRLLRHVSWVLFAISIPDSPLTVSKIRRLSWPRYSDDDHAVWRRSHGRCFAAHCWQRNMPATTDL